MNAHVLAVKFVRIALSLGLVVLLGSGGALPAGAAVAFLPDPGEGDFDVTGSLKVTAADPAGQVLFNWQDKSKDHYVLSLAKGTARFQSVIGGKTTPLGNPASLKLAKGQTVSFTIQRRAWRMALVWGDRVLLQAYDSRLAGGKVGSAATKAVWEDLRVQPVGDIVMFDDFVREEGAQSLWEPQSGTWQSRTLRDDEQAAREEADKSANAFSYFGTGSPHGITVAGYWFWDRYAFEAAVKPVGSGAAGLVCHYQDEQNYVALRFSDRLGAAADGNRLQLVAVRGGKAAVLAERPGGYLSGQWYKLRLEVCEDRIVALVDGEPRLTVRTPVFGQGQIGLYVESKDGAFFDDIACDGWEWFEEDFAQAVPGKWTMGKDWAVANGQLVSRGAVASASLLGGRWARYTCAAESRSLGGGAGLVFGHAGAKDYLLVRWAPATAACAFKGKAQLVHVAPTGEKVLDEKPAPAGTTQRLEATVDQGLLTARVGDGVSLQALLPGRTGGAVGLYAVGKASFDDLSVRLVQPRRGSHITKEFGITDKHPEMAEWASTQAPWVQPKTGETTWWTKGDYYGDATLAFTVPAVGSRSGSCRAVLAGEAGKDQGLVLTVSAAAGVKKLTLALAAEGKDVGKAEVDVAQDAHVVFSREGRMLVVKVNEQLALSAPF